MDEHGVVLLDLGSGYEKGVKMVEWGSLWHSMEQK